MNQLKTLTVVFLFAYNIVSAQKNLQPGYIVQNNNDTLKGFINYKEWDKSPVNIQFAATKESALQKFDKNEISYFEITNKEAYARYSINFSLDPDQFDKLSDRDTSTKTDIVFLKVIYRGNTESLFAYSDEIKLRYYLLSAGETTPVELKNSSYLQNGQVKNDYQYRNQLLAESQRLFPGDASMIQLISKAEYSKPELLEVFYQLNGVSKNEAKPIGAGGKSPTRFFAGIGLNMGTTGFSGQVRYAGNKSTVSYAPVLSAGMDMFFNPEIGKLFLRGIVNVTGAKCEADEVEAYYASTDHYHYELKQTNAALLIQVNYNLYNQPLFKWFIGAGGEINYFFYSKNTQILTRVGLSGTTVTVDDDYLHDARKLGLAAALSTGVSIHKLDLVFTYLPASNLSGTAGFSLDYSSLQFQVLYKFGKK